MQLSPYQRDAIRESLRLYGELPLAAHQAGITVGMLRRHLNADEAFAEEVEHQISIHGSAMVVLAQQRASAGDNTMLKTLLEAKVPGYSRESRQATTAKPQTQPVTLVLRDFDDDGTDVSDVSDVPYKALPLAPLL